MYTNTERYCLIDCTMLTKVEDYQIFFNPDQNLLEEGDKNLTKILDKVKTNETRYFELVSKKN